MKIVVKENIETVESFQKHVVRLSLKPIALVLLIVLALGIVFMVGDRFYSGLFLVLFSIMFAAVFPFSLKKANQKLNESNKTVFMEKFIEMEFFEEKLSTKTYLNEELINSFVCKYIDIYKVDETKKYFYVYIAMNQAFCIGKDDIDEKDANEIRGLLQSSCSKYKIFK